MLNGDVVGTVNALELYFMSCGLSVNLFRTCWNDVMLSSLLDAGSFVLAYPLDIFSGM